MIDGCRIITQANRVLDLHVICGKRTVTTENIYLTEFIPVLQGRIEPLLALSATYYKSITDRRAVEDVEVRYIIRTARYIRSAVDSGRIDAYTAVAGVLLNHHATVEPSLHGCCWTKYLYEQSSCDGHAIDSNIIQASVAILAMATVPVQSNRKFLKFNYGWVGQGDTRQLQRVNGNIGLSRELLDLIYQLFRCLEVTVSTTTTDDHDHRPGWRDPSLLLSKIENCFQFVSSNEGYTSQIITGCTAESYRLAAILYCLARNFGYDPFPFGKFVSRSAAIFRGIRMSSERAVYYLTPFRSYRRRESITAAYTPLGAFSYFVSASKDLRFITCSFERWKGLLQAINPSVLDTIVPDATDYRSRAWMTIFVRT